MSQEPVLSSSYAPSAPGLGGLGVPGVGRWRALAVAGMLLGLPWPALAQTITATEGPGLPAVQITGGTEEQRTNVRSFLPMNRYTCTLSPLSERGVLRDAGTRAGLALRALGHYQADFRIDILRQEDCWELHVDIDPGPPTRITAIDLQFLEEAQEDPEFAQLRAEPGIRPGDVLRHDAYERLRTRISRLASERGYLDATFSLARLEVDPQQHEARIVLHLVSGPRYRFGAVQMEQEILQESLLARLSPFQAGDPYHVAQLVQLQQNLSDSGYFTAVRVRPLPEQSQDGVIPILAEAEARARRAYQFRIGASTDTGPRLGLKLDRRYANRRGHRYNAELEAAQQRLGLGFQYDIPLLDPLRERLTLSSSLLQETVGSTDLERAQVGISRIRQQASGWQVTEGLRYEYEEFTVADQSGIARLLMPSYRLSRSEADDPLLPRQGFRVDGTLQGTSTSLGSTLSLLQLRGYLKLVEGLGNGRLLLRGEVGATFGSEVVDLPGSLRFFAGGDTSVRGYGYQRLGPADASGRIVGGRHLLVGSAEIEWPVRSSRWSVASFIDTGNAFNDPEAYTLKTGVGIGVRWRSPIGPLRFDLAHAPDSTDAVRIHFTMGPDL
jgi:translocation and assembly module TamA